MKVQYLECIGHEYRYLEMTQEQVDYAKTLYDAAVLAGNDDGWIALDEYMADMQSWAMDVFICSDPTDECNEFMQPGTGI